jgi:DNA-binding response OmpR family regulator
LDAGADDYLVKPFSAHELMARVRAHVRLSRARAEAADQVRHVVYQPLRDEYGAIDAIAIVGVEVTPLVRARAAAESANADKMQFLRR